MSVLIVIPARYASTRFPGKPLAKLRGASGHSKTLIERSWRAACEVSGVTRTVVATDDERIRDAVNRFGGETVMTSTECQNGTERCSEVVEKLAENAEHYDIIVNFQGDAPLIPHWFVTSVIEDLAQSATQVAMTTPVLRCSAEALVKLKEDRAQGRVGGTTAVFDQNHLALYFSKEVIPFTTSQKDPAPVFHHVGLYAYRPDALAQYKQLATGKLETLEGLEQLRFLENGFCVKCTEVEAHDHPFWELNNPTDIEAIEDMLRRIGRD